MSTHDEVGCPESGSVYFQVKASEHLKRVRGDVVFDLDVRDYHQRTRDKHPVILVLVEFGVPRRAFWLFIQEYFQASTSPRPRRGAKTVRVRIPADKVFDQHAVADIREINRMFLELDLRDLP